jgi:hypothetical protein
LAIADPAIDGIGHAGPFLNLYGVSADSGTTTFPGSITGAPFVYARHFVVSRRSGPPTRKTRFRYDYDSQGNRVSKTTEGRSGAGDEFTLSAIERRAITYFVQQHAERR